MDEAAARTWVEERFDVSRETSARLDRLIAATISENEAQNLIARSTIDHFWTRHIVDSAQLLALTPAEGAWIDLGSGAGFPGLVVAILADRPVTLVEMRRKRAVHLEAMVDHLGLGGRVTVAHARVEQVGGHFAAISARAYAPLDRLFASALHLSSPDSCWVLPKGRGAASELEAVAGTWQGRFRIEPSVTDSEGAIIVATDVRRGKKA